MTKETDNKTNDKTKLRRNKNENDSLKLRGTRYFYFAIPSFCVMIDDTSVVWCVSMQFSMLIHCDSERNFTNDDSIY